MPDGNLDKATLPQPEVTNTDREKEDAEKRARALDALEKMGPQNASDLALLIKKNWAWFASLPPVAAILTYNEFDTYTNIFGEEVPDIQNAIVGGGLAGILMATIVLLFVAMPSLYKK